jgi:endonuclease G, mitochondrial
MASRKSSDAKGESAEGPSAEALRRHIRAKGADYLKDPNITSVGIGLKNGKGPLCIQFTVGAKGESAIETLGSPRIPETIKVDGKAVPTDVIERSYRPSYKLVELQQMDQRRGRIDPIQPGVSVSHIVGSAGTLGLIVFDRATGQPCILSNWHVLHGNAGQIGDTIVQPGPFDDNNTAMNDTGQLLRSHLGAAGDCALARIRQRGFDRSVYGLNVVPKRMAEVALGDRVVKAGRTTGVTYGVVRRVDVMARIDYGPPAGSVPIGGFEIGSDPKHPAPEGEISMAGDSGAAWLIAEGGKPTDIFAGLHFAGDASSAADEHALACYSSSVQQKLDFVFEPPGATAGADLPETVAPRTGYDANFLGLPVPEPALSAALKRDAVNFGGGQTIPYTHFTVCLSSARRMARYVAWNVDGARLAKLPRTGFSLDPRIDAKLQVGEEVYADNKLDRGHIARRADLCWGPVEEAKQANKDSFYFTNIAPQHQRFNQSSRSGLWGELEDLVFEQADVLDIRLSVIGGPIFGKDDTPYRSILLPGAFWKLIAYRGANDNGLRCSAFLLSQDELLSDLERLDLDPFRIYQIDLAELTQRTSLDFSALTGADVAAHPEIATRLATSETVGSRAAPIVEVRSRADIRF